MWELYYTFNHLYILMMEEKNDDVSINVSAHTSDYEHDLGDDEWSKSQYSNINYLRTVIFVVVEQ